MLAEALLAKGSPRSGVLEALEQRWSKLSSSDHTPVIERAQLEAHWGEFGEALDAIEEYDRLTERDPNLAAHARSALLRLENRREMGDDALALVELDRFYERSPAWTAPVGFGANEISPHVPRGARAPRAPPRPPPRPGAADRLARPREQGRSPVEDGRRGAHGRAPRDLAGAGARVARTGAALERGPRASSLERSGPRSPRAPPTQRRGARSRSPGGSTRPSPSSASRRAAATSSTER